MGHLNGLGDVLLTGSYFQSKLLIFDRRLGAKLGAVVSLVCNYTHNSFLTGF